MFGIDLIHGIVIIALLAQFVNWGVSAAYPALVFVFYTVPRVAAYFFYLKYNQTTSKFGQRSYSIYFWAKAGSFIAFFILMTSFSLKAASIKSTYSNSTNEERE